MLDRWQALLVKAVNGFEDDALFVYDANKNFGTRNSRFSSPCPLPKTLKPVKVTKAYRGIQYNACKNPVCSQYGLPAPETAIKGVTGPYSVVYGGKKYPLLRCNICGEMPPLKSNQGIVEEVDRLSAYLNKEEWICPNERSDGQPK